MPTRFEHRASFSAPATQVYSALTDRTFLQERLRELGGRGATLTDYTADDHQVTIRLRQVVPAEQLPAAARAFLKGDLVVDREERWTKSEGDGRATISGIPGEITSHSRVTDTPGGSELVTTADVRVGIPLVGAKLETVVAEQVGKLLAAESNFTRTWLAEHSS